PIGFAAAAPCVPDNAIPAVSRKRPDQAADISALRIPFQSVRDHGDAARALRGPIQIEKIAIRCRNALTLVSHASNRSEEHRPEGLKVAVSQSPGRLVSRVRDDRHDQGYVPRTDATTCGRHPGVSEQGFGLTFGSRWVNPRGT